MSQGSKGAFATKFLIFVFLLSLVAIGAEYVRGEYGSILEFISGDTSAFAGQLRGGARGTRGGAEDSARGQADWSFFSRSRDRQAREDEPERGKEVKAGDMDRLSRQDRKSLDRLIQGLD